MWNLYILWLSVVSIMAIELGPCDPDCTSASPFEKVEDPYNCTQFYFCLADHTPTDHSVPCPDGKSFDPEGGDCTGTLPCTPLCGGGGDGGCHLTCNGTGDVISDPFNCNIFYECDAAGPKPPRTCPGDRPYFDGESCVSDEDVCCVPSCEPICEAAATQVPDPKDCKRFYICMDAGTPDETLHFSCKSGETFDIGTGHCSPSADCKILCPSSSTSVPMSSSSVNPTDTSESSTSSSECIDSLTCSEPGYFAKCKTCVPEYFLCKAAGEEGEQKKCTAGKLFNPVSDFPSCILPGNCPYYP